MIVGDDRRVFQKEIKERTGKRHRKQGGGRKQREGEREIQGERDRGGEREREGGKGKTKIN